MMWALLYLLAVHWFADFVLQTHWQASNKNKDNVALFRHVAVYTAVLGIAALVFAWPDRWSNWLAFVAVNGLLHFVTDYRTSRISSELFLGELEQIQDNFGNHDTRTALKVGFNPHNFFVMIGFDQLIHQATLAVTLWSFFS